MALFLDVRVRSDRFLVVYQSYLFGHNAGMGAITIVASILGMILGTAGFVMSVLSYLRDRPRVKVTLQWDMVDVTTREVRGLVRAKT